MDECEQADVFTNRYLNGEIARIKKQNDNGRESPTHCAECGEAIPEARREAQPGCELCVHCQSELERMT